MKSARSYLLPCWATRPAHWATGGCACIFNCPFPSPCRLLPRGASRFARWYTAVGVDPSRPFGSIPGLPTGPYSGGHVPPPPPPPLQYKDSRVPALPIHLSPDNTCDFNSASTAHSKDQAGVGICLEVRRDRSRCSRCSAGRWRRARRGSSSRARRAAARRGSRTRSGRRAPAPSASASAAAPPWRIRPMTRALSSPGQEISTSVRQSFLLLFRDHFLSSAWSVDDL